MKANEIDRIFRQHYDRMIRLARTMLYDDEESRDVVSEVFAMLVKTDIMPRNIENYLTTSVRNRCLNLLEHKEVRERFEQAYTAEKVSESASQPPLTTPPLVYTAPPLPLLVDRHDTKRIVPLLPFMFS